MITDIQLALFANFLGVSLFLLVVLYHYVASNPRSWKLLEFWFSKSCDLCVWWYKSFIEWKILQYSITLQYCLTVLYYHSFGHIVYFYTTIAISFADYKSDKNFIWSFREDFDKDYFKCSSKHFFEQCQKPFDSYRGEGRHILV